MKRLFLPLCAAALMLGAGFAQAAGTFQLRGHLHSFTPQVVAVNVDKTTYYLKKSKLAPSQVEYLAGLKTGQALILAVDYRAIESVEDVKTK